MEKLSLKWGFASRRPSKEKESFKFDFPYVEMLAPEDKKGAISKFRLLNGTVQTMKFNLAELESKIAYAQNPENTKAFYLVNVSLLDEVLPVSHKVNKDGSFNSSVLQERICTELNLNPTENHYFSIKDLDAAQIEEYGGLPIVELIPIVDAVINTNENLESDNTESENSDEDDKSDIVPEIE